MRYMKPVAAALAVAIGASTLVGTAEAGRRHHHHHGSDAGGLAVAGIFGLAAGAILGSALTQPRYYNYEPAYVQPLPPPVVYEEATPVYYTRSAPPWSQAWYDHCSRFPSFDPQTGYLYSPDGTYHFCR